VTSHLNFNRDRIHPSLTESASLGAELYTHEKHSLKLQGDLQNLSNKLQVLDFGGLFSGNAIGPARTLSVRLTSSF